MKGLLIAFAIARSLDLGTTYIALQKGKVEDNHLLPQNPTLNVSIGAALTVGQLLFFHKFNQFHPKIAKWCLSGGLAIESAVAAHNANIVWRVK